jgi:hypothetical protein
MVEGFIHRFVYHCLSTCFPPSGCGNPYPVVEQLPTIGVLFSSNPESWLMAFSYCIFINYPKIQSRLAPNINIDLCGYWIDTACILAFCQKDGCFLTVVVVKLFSSSGIGKRRYIFVFFLIPSIVKLTLISSLQILEAPMCTGLFYSCCLCSSRV